MRLWLDSEYIEFTNDEAGITDLIKVIENKAFDMRDKFFSHLIIDGVEVHNDYRGYIEENIANIRDISMEFITISEYVAQILDSTNDYLTRATQAIEGLAEAFYQGADANAWRELDNMLEGIEWLGETFNIIDSVPGLGSVMPDYEKWNTYSKALREMQAVLPNLKESLESGDYVSISDIILYEVKPALENMRANIPMAEDSI